MDGPRDRARAVRMKVLERLAKKGSISTSEVAGISGLDERSARRVVSSLSELVPGVTRFRGGATFQRSPYEGTDFGAALHSRTAHKRAIAHAVARRLLHRIQPSSVFLGSGTSAYYVAESLAVHGIPRLVIMTNNLAAVDALRDRCCVSVSGGQVCWPTASLEGQAAAEGIRRFRSDVVVVSSCSISLIDGSLRYRSPEQETTIRAVFDSTYGEVIVASDSSKFSTSAPFGFSSLHAILEAGARRVTVVTDSELCPSDAEAFESTMRTSCGDAFNLVVAAIAPTEMGSASKLRKDPTAKVA